MLLHEQIYHDIFKLIADGNYKRGDLLPSEKKLMEQYRCSLAPVRQAMGQLEQLGLVERRRGKGTFVRSNDASDFRLDLVGFTGALYNERNEWIYKTKRVEIVRADEELAERKKKWQPREPKVNSGYLKRYANMVTSGSTGAILK